MVFRALSSGVSGIELESGIAAGRTAGIALYVDPPSGMQAAFHHPPKLGIAR
jgi:hypothetical protein